jgi:hypothetical protein
MEIGPASRRLKIPIYAMPILAVYIFIIWTLVVIAVPFFHLVPPWRPAILRMMRATASYLPPLPIF